MQPVQPKGIQLGGKPIGGGRFPAICMPLVGRTRETLRSEAAAVAAKKPDIIEWRVDFFEGIADTAEVIEAASEIRQAAAGLPLLFTRRSVREGGEKIALAERQVIELYRAVCTGGQADIVDFEMGNEPDHVREVRELSRASGVQLILSFHDFSKTPPVDFLNERFAQAERLGADIAKVAVMPRAMDDILVLLMATLQSSRALDIPVVSMAMGGHGALTRVGGWAFGSAMTFAAGESRSAPGQMPIEDVQAALAVLQRALGEP
jgi:3-dehydroquinate dehydratase I